MFIKDLNKRCYIKWRITHVCNYACTYCLHKNLREIKNHDLAAEDFQRCFTAIPYVIDIAKQLKEINKREVGVDLIGGEISMYDDLGKFIELLFRSEYITKINMTTNFHREKEYYDALYDIAEKYNKQLSITASFHYEFADIDTFFEKAIYINSKHHNGFYIETVKTEENNYVDEILKICNENNIYYNIDYDLSNGHVNCDTEKLTNKVIKDRYLVRFDNGIEKPYKTRNQFLKEYGECTDGISHVLTSGRFCSRDSDYVYLDRDMAIPCHSAIPIQLYKVDPHPRTCYGWRCTICGHMSISDNEQDLINMRGNE